MAKIYTKTGDSGDTGLSTGLRVGKDSYEIKAIGNVDELNCVIGMVLAYQIPDDLREELIHIQHQLFNVGAELNNPDLKFKNTHIVKALEDKMDAYDKELTTLKNFILPGGGHASATCHLARAVCRRAERSVVELSRHQVVNPSIYMYLNRLSDFLFIACRILSKHAGKEETIWSSEFIAEGEFY